MIALFYCSCISGIFQEFLVKKLYLISYNKRFTKGTLCTLKFNVMAYNVCVTTVNLEIFASVLFSRNFAYAKFRENKIFAKWRNYSVVY